MTVERLLEFAFLVGGYRHGDNVLLEFVSIRTAIEDWGLAVLLHLTHDHVGEATGFMVLIFFSGGFRWIF